MNSYNIQEKEKVLVIELARPEGLRSVQILNDRDQEKCRTISSPFEVLSKKFNLQHNETILSMQY